MSLCYALEGNKPCKQRLYGHETNRARCLYIFSQRYPFLFLPFLCKKFRKNHFSPLLEIFQTLVQIPTYLSLYVSRIIFKFSSNACAPSNQITLHLRDFIQSSCCCNVQPPTPKSYPAISFKNFWCSAYMSPPSKIRLPNKTNSRL